MRKLSATAACAAALLAAGGVSASAASAARLFLTSTTGEVAPPGTSSALNGFISPESPPPWQSCNAFFITGTLAVNGAAKDKVSFPAGESNCSEEGQTMLARLALGTMVLTSKGTYTASGRIQVQRFGPCTYEIRKVRGTFPLSGPLRVDTHGLVGKRRASLSSSACPKTQQFEFSWQLIDGANEETYEAEVGP
jgi:hypothetical protein